MFWRTFTYFELAWSMHFYTSSFSFSIFTLFVRRSAFCAFFVHRSRIWWRFYILGQTYELSIGESTWSCATHGPAWVECSGRVVNQEKQTRNLAWPCEPHTAVPSFEANQSSILTWPCGSTWPCKVSRDQEGPGRVHHTAVQGSQRLKVFWPCAPHDRDKFLEAGAVQAVWIYMAVLGGFEESCPWPCTTHGRV